MIVDVYDNKDKMKAFFEQLTIGVETAITSFIIMFPKEIAERVSWSMLTSQKC